MNEFYNSSLSNKRIAISILLIVCIPLFSYLFNIYAKQYDISLMVSFNLFTCILLIYDWNLFGIHYNRSKKDIQFTIIYIIVGVIAIGILSILNTLLFHGNLVLPKKTTLTSYGYARPGLFLGFSFVQSLALSIFYKCLTDRFQIQNKELQTILISSFVIGFIYLVAFNPFDLYVWIKTYVYNIILIAILAYLYNQSHSLLPGCIAMGIVYFILMLI